RPPLRRPHRAPGVGGVRSRAPLGRAPAAARVRSRPAPSDSPCFERGRGPRVTGGGCHYAYQRPAWTSTGLVGATRGEGATGSSPGVVLTEEGNYQGLARLNAALIQQAGVV